MIASHPPAGGEQNPGQTFDQGLDEPRAPRVTDTLADLFGTNRQYEGEQTIAAMVQFVVSLNLKRRHLDSGQRAMAAVMAGDIVAKFEAEARERQRLAGIAYGENHPKQELDKTFYQALDEPTRAPQAIDTLADLFGTNRQYVNEAQSYF